MNFSIKKKTGLLVNENADAEAKKAAARDRVDDATLDVRDFKRIVSEFEFTARKNRWANVEDNKMKEHKILLSKNRTYLTRKRSEDVFITRIRIGRTKLTHGYLMKSPPERVQPLCESCGRVLTIKHLLVKCTRYDGHRVRLLGDQGLRSVLAESEGTTKRIIKFFREINLFDDV
jgi:hypothetical protein